MPPPTFILSKLPSPLICCICALGAAAAIAEAREMSSVLRHKCQTRFTFSRPTRDHVASILFGDSESECSGADQSKIPFNHGDRLLDVLSFSTSPVLGAFPRTEHFFSSTSQQIDAVGVTQPVVRNKPFPSCLGYPDETEKHAPFHKELESVTNNDDETTTRSSRTDVIGWRILRFHRRVGYGKQCYRQVQNALFDWDFESRTGKKSMGILSATPETSAQFENLSVRANANSAGFTRPKRGLLATFTEVTFPGPLKSLFVVNPVHVAYEVKNARHIPSCLFSCTAYATLKGHLLAGEERVTAVWRKGTGEVEIEIVSFSRAADSVAGRLAWPLIGRMQKTFFLSELDHLANVAMHHVAFLLHLMFGAAHSLSMQTAQSAPDRRNFLSRCTSAIAPCLNAPFPVLAVEMRDNEDIANLLDAKTIFWNGSLWSSCRYGTSRLQAANNSNRQKAAPPQGKPTFYPKWLDGYLETKYKFVGATFPQGRGVLSLRTAGAGLGTCLSLPNVGYSPPAAHALHFIRSEGSDGHDDVYEDLAYNVPRRFESFWPQAKVLAVQTNGSRRAGGPEDNILPPKCFVTGDGCSYDVNPNLRLPASRVAIEFDGPVRRGGRVVQVIDATMLDHATQCDDANNQLYTTKSYSQYNVDQDLQTFYKEITTLQKIPSGDGIVGKIRVAAFLPRYIKYMDDSSSSAGDAYDETEAVAIYDYKVFMKGIDAEEAASL
ncbi:hypothetical protein ACHAWF_012066 [Thalassiosira exigua]